MELIRRIHNLNLFLVFTIYTVLKLLFFACFISLKTNIYSHFFSFILLDGSNYGINGNVSLNRQGELSSPQHRYDLSMGSDKSSSLSRSEGGVYDVVQAESRINNQPENNGNMVNSELYPMNGHSTLDSRDGSDSSKRRVRT